MLPLSRFLFAPLLLLAVSRQCDALVLQAGLSVQPPESLDLTYQAIPSYDKEQKVIAGWAGPKLRYFISVQKLPPGWLDPKAYFSGVARDLRAAGGTVEEGAQGEYTAASGLKGSYLALRLKLDPGSPVDESVAHFITDGKVAFFAYVSLTGISNVEQVTAETVSLFKTASISIGIAPVGARKRNESPYFGTWLAEETGPGGARLTSRLPLNEDLSFATQVALGGTTVLNATGVWLVDGRTLTWTYMYTSPPLPADAKTDQDEVLAISRDRLVVRSLKSGKTHAYRRIK